MNDNAEELPEKARAADGARRMKIEIAGKAKDGVRILRQVKVRGGNFTYAQAKAAVRNAKHSLLTAGEE